MDSTHKERKTKDMMLMPRRNFDLFDDVFNDPFFNINESKIMRTDIKEHNDYFELLIDLPGFNKEDIKMHIEDGYLTINASSNNSEEKKEEGKFVRKERYYGQCSRSFYIGENINEKDIKAKFQNGTLKIEIPKVEKENLSNKKYIEIED